MPSFKVKRESSVLAESELPVESNGSSFTGPAHCFRFHPIQPDVSTFSKRCPEMEVAPNAKPTVQFNLHSL